MKIWMSNQHALLWTHYVLFWEGKRLPVLSSGQCVWNVLANTVPTCIPGPTQTSRSLHCLLHTLWSKISHNLLHTWPLQLQTGVEIHTSTILVITLVYQKQQSIYGIKVDLLRSHTHAHMYTHIHVTATLLSLQTTCHQKQIFPFQFLKMNDSVMTTSSDRSEEKIFHSFWAFGTFWHCSCKELSVPVCGNCSSTLYHQNPVLSFTGNTVQP